MGNIIARSSLRRKFDLLFKMATSYNNKYDNEFAILLTKMDKNAIDPKGGNSVVMILILSGNEVYACHAIKEGFTLRGVNNNFESAFDLATNSKMNKVVTLINSYTNSRHFTGNRTYNTFF